MERAEVYEKLNEVFRDFFDDEEIVLADETTAKDIDGWDSLEHIGLMVAVEKAFGIRFNMGEVNEFQNVGELAGSILGKVEKQA